MERSYNGQIAFYRSERLAGYDDVIHGVFTRHGGLSQGPYASLNLGCEESCSHRAERGQTGRFGVLIGL